MAMGMPFMNSAFASSLQNLQHLSSAEIAIEEDFWLQVRKDYDLKPEYINL